MSLLYCLTSAPPSWQQQQGALSASAFALAFTLMIDCSSTLSRSTMANARPLSVSMKHSLMSMSLY